MRKGTIERFVYFEITLNVWKLIIILIFTVLTFGNKECLKRIVYEKKKQN